MRLYPFSAFQADIRSFSSDVTLQIKNEIVRAEEGYILNVGENQYIEYLVNQYVPMFPVVEFEAGYIDGNSLERVRFCVPVTGDIKLLSYQPQEVRLSQINLPLYFNERHELVFDLTSCYTSEEIEMRIDLELGKVKPNYEFLKRDFKQLAENLNQKARDFFTSRRDQLLRKLNLLSELNVPIKKRPDNELTFNVRPPELRRQVPVRPNVDPNVPFQPEPTLPTDSYRDILQIINDTGKNFERTPSIFKNKEEEDLRNHLLMVLAPNLVGVVASGEMFNNNGKTDISITYQSSVVFVSECKFWTGEKGYHDTIDQLLSYLTWRNTKTSIVLFVRNVSITNVVDQISGATKRHVCFVREREKTEEGWFNFVMYLPSDPQKEILMAVQLFHIQ